MKYFLAEGTIVCTWKGEKKSASFRDGLKIPDLNFSQGDIVQFELEIQDVGGLNPLARITGAKREGILYFKVFPSGRKTKPFSGLTTLFLDANKEEQDCRLSQLSVNEMYDGGVGTMDVELHINRLIG